MSAVCWGDTWARRATASDIEQVKHRWAISTAFAPASSRHGSSPGLAQQTHQLTPDPKLSPPVHYQSDYHDTPAAVRHFRQVRPSTRVHSGQGRPLRVASELVQVQELGGEQRSRRIREQDLRQLLARDGAATRTSGTRVESQRAPRERKGASASRGTGCRGDPRVELDRVRQKLKCLSKPRSAEEQARPRSRLPSAPSSLNRFAWSLN